jgi:hypothetical protein
VLELFLMIMMFGQVRGDLILLTLNYCLIKNHLQLLLVVIIMSSDCVSNRHPVLCDTPRCSQLGLRQLLAIPACQ